MSSTSSDPILRATVRTTVAMGGAATVFLTVLSLVLGIALAVPKSGAATTTSADGTSERTSTETKGAPKTNALPPKAQKPPAEI